MIEEWRDRDRWLNIVFFGDGTRKSEMRGDEWNDHEKLVLLRMSCASQCTIPNTAGTRPLLWHFNTHVRSSQPNLASRTHDFSYPLIFSTWFSSLSPTLSFLPTTVPSPQTRKSSHPTLSRHAMILSWHRVQHTPSTTYTRCSIPEVQHTPSIAYTMYRILRVQHTQSTVSTLDYLSSLYCHDWKLTPEYSFSFQHASLHDPPLSSRYGWEFTGKLILLHSNGCKLTSWWIESQHPALHESTACKSSSNVTQSRARSASPY